MADRLIQARELTRVYRTDAGDVDALRGVDLDIQAGEIVAILGPSGCGKTTLVNCLSGIDVPTSGTVSFDGQRLDGLSDQARTRLRSRQMGFVFQAFNLIQVLSAAENVEMPLLLQAGDRSTARERALAALDQVGLADRAEHLPAQLSGGEQQRVALARSLVTEPRVVWADEPTGNLDAESGKRVLALMEDLNESFGQTYVIVTHDLKVVEIADRVLHMESGQIDRDERGRRRLA